MRGAAAGLLTLIAALLVLMLTVGRDNNFGFACFLAFVVASAALVGIGLAALVRRRQARVD